MQVLNLSSEFDPAGDQPSAINALVKGLNAGEKYQTLLGVTGSGKTFTIANVLEQVKRPALIISQNKTLAAQLYSEFKHFFPENRVEYFVSYFDYYLPEAYIPQTDTYIAKDSSVNNEIEKFRLSATASLMERSDVIVIASVSCIYGLGSPTDTIDMTVKLSVGMEMDRDEMLSALVQIQYSRNDCAPTRGEFCVNGDVVDIFPSYRDEFYRIEFWGDEVERITVRDQLTRKLIEEPNETMVFPASHFVAKSNKVERVISLVTAEMKKQVKKFESEGKLVEAQRIFQRTNYDMEMLRELGFCSGIENYSRYISDRNEGDKPYTLMDYFPEDFVLIVDESHVTLPQFRGMYKADRSRKMTLVEHGFRLPSALDNRPMNYDEFDGMINQAIFVSATPANYEMERTNPVDLVVRPTGLLDPEIEIRPLANQIDDLMEEVIKRRKIDERTIVTCLTKKTSEDLTDYFVDAGLKASYIHSELGVIERIDVLNRLRTGKIDCIIGINLLREGMDLPEVSLVAILDADKEGFLRSETAMMQIAGRAARNSNGRVIMYADKMTKSMKAVIKTTDIRRKEQKKYNDDHGITPRTITRTAEMSLGMYVSEEPAQLEVAEEEEVYGGTGEDLLIRLKREMLEASESLEFERAASLRDKIAQLTGQKVSHSKKRKRY